MKDWNATASKFYSETMNALAKFFGLDAENTTEAELHQHVTEAGTLESIRAEAAEKVADKMTAFETQMADFNAKFAEMETRLSALHAENEERGQKIEALTGQIATLQSEIEARETVIAAHKATIAQVSGELATLRAGRVGQLDAPPDASLETPSGSAAPVKKNIMTMADVAALLGNN